MRCIEVAELSHGSTSACSPALKCTQTLRMASAHVNFTSGLGFGALVAFILSITLSLGGIVTFVKPCSHSLVEPA